MLNPSASAQGDNTAPFGRAERFAVPNVDAAWLDQLAIYVEAGLSFVPLGDGSAAKDPNFDVLRRRFGEAKWAWLRDWRPNHLDLLWLHELGMRNVGVLTGFNRRLGWGLAVVDVDHPDRLERLALPGGPRVITGGLGHYHAYFRIDQPTPSAEYSWGELLADGRYAVAPPSVGESGRPYWFIEPFTLPLPMLPALFPSPSRASARARPVPPDVTSNQRVVTRFTGDWSDTWSALLRDRTFAQDIARLWGITKSSSFPCVLPDAAHRHRHGDRKPSAGVRPSRSDGHFRYWCSCLPGKSLALAEVHASRGAGEVLTLRTPELATWTLRLMVETGRLKAAQVIGAELPADVAVIAGRVYGGFLRLLAVKWSAKQYFSAPTAFSYRFAARWCHVTVREAGDAIRLLRERGFIRRIGFHRAGGRSWSEYGLGPGIAESASTSPVISDTIGAEKVSAR